MLFQVSRYAEVFNSLVTSLPQISNCTCAALIHPSIQQRPAGERSPKPYTLSCWCIHQLFEQQVNKTPEAIAIVYEDEQLTYQQLNHRSNKIAHYLQKLGVAPEVLVGICIERSLLMLVGILGILKAGGAYLPLDPTYPPE